MPQEAGYNESSVVLPSLFGPPGAALENAIGRRQQDKAFEYHRRKEQEMDDWRKVNLIKELTNLDDYQTGSDVANAIGNRQANSVLQKYTAEAKNMAPAELLAKIQQDMTGIHTGLQGLKNEMDIADKTASVMKQQNPELRMGDLSRDMRADIINRRLKGDEGFVNPMEVSPTQMDLSNDDFLSKYVGSDKTLREEITNPKGMEDVSAVAGRYEENFPYAGKMPFWKKPSFTEEEVKKGGGFLPKGTVPKLLTKEEPISTDILKGKDGKQLMGATPDVYKAFTDNPSYNRQLIANTRSGFKDYDEMSPEQKEAAKSVTLRQMLDLDKSDFKAGHPQRAFAPKTSNTFNMGGGDESKINKVYERLNKKIDDNIEKGFGSTRFNSLSNDEQEVVKNAVKNAGFLDSNGEAAIGEGGQNIHIVKDKNGKIKIYKVGENRDLSLKPENEIATLSYEGTNVPKQVNVGGKIQAVQKGESGKAVTKPPSKQSDPLGIR